jgi:hypothetical protein
LADHESLAIDPAASVTIVAYRDRKVVWTTALRSAELRGKETRSRCASQIAERIPGFLSDETPRSP